MVVVVAVEILRSGVVAGGAMEEEEEEEDDDVATRRVDKKDDDDAEKKLLLPCLHDDSIGISSPYRQDICLPPSGCKVTCRPTNDMPAAWVHDHVDSGT